MPRKNSVSILRDKYRKHGADLTADGYVIDKATGVIINTSWDLELVAENPVDVYLDPRIDESIASDIITLKEQIASGSHRKRR